MKIDFFACSFFHTLHSFRNELYAIKNFHTHSEEYWQSVEEDVNNALQADIKDADEEEHENIVDCYVEELINAQSAAPKFHRETILVSLYSQVEYCLLNFCSSFNQEIMGGDSNFYDLSSRDVLGNISKYMQMKMEFNLISFENEWKYLASIKHIRNRLVHSNGKVIRNLKEIKSFCEENESYKIRNDFIVIQSGAIDDVIIKFRSLLDKLENETQLFIARHQKKFGVYEHKGFNND